MADIKIVGIEKLEKQLKKNISLNEVKKVVKQNGSELQKAAKKEAVFNGHYEYVKGVGWKFKKPTRNLKKNIMLEITNGGMTAEVQSTAEYAAYVELGTRFMDAQPYLKPALKGQEPKFRADMRKLVK